MRIPALPMMLALCLLLPAQALALTADEVLRLRGAGVSDETIQKMLDQERQRALTPPAAAPSSSSQPSSASPQAAAPAPAAGQAPPASAASVVETKDEVIYRAGQNVPEDVRRMERQERERERSNREMLRNVIIDTRTPPPPTGSGQSTGAGQGQAK